MNPAGASLGVRASRSVFWIAVGNYGEAIVSLGVMAILSRLLTPRDFGLVAMVAVFSGFVGSLAETGISDAVIQHRDLDQRGLSSIFWMSLIMGVAGGAIMALASPVVAALFRVPELLPVVAALGCSMLFLALGRVPAGILERDFRFREMSLAKLLASGAGGALAIVLALRGAGYWSLVAQTLASTLINAASRFVLAGFVPSVVFDRSLVRRATSYSGGITAFSAVNYWARNLDNLVVGRVLGATQLAYYVRAYALMLYPMSALNGIVNPVLHPLFVRLSDVPDQLTQAYRRTVVLIASVALPLMAVLALLAPELVRTFWGPQWDRSVDIFAILCLIGAVQPISGTFGSVFLAKGRTALLAVVGTLNALIIMTGIVLGLRWGLEGVAIGYSIAFASIFGPTLYLVYVRLLGGRLTELLFSLLRPAAVALSLALLLFGYNTALRGLLSDPVHLGGGVLLALAAYALLMLRFNGPLIDEVAEVLPSRWQALLVRLTRQAGGALPAAVDRAR